MKLVSPVFTLLILFSSLVTPQSSNTYVALKNDVKIYGKIEIHTPFFARSYVTVNDTIKYYVKDIGFVQTEDGYYGALDGNLLERVHTGRLDLYQRREFDVMSTPHTFSTPDGSYTQWSPDFKMKLVDYYSKEGGTLREVTCSNLQKDLADNPRSMELLKEYKTLSYVRWGIGAVGVGIVISAFIGSSKENPVKKGNLIVGAVVANLSWIPYLLQGQKLEDAIRIYNEPQYK